MQWEPEVHEHLISEPATESHAQHDTPKASSSVVIGILVVQVWIVPRPLHDLYSLKRSVNNFENYSTLMRAADYIPIISESWATMVVRVQARL